MLLLAVDCSTGSDLGKIIGLLKSFLVILQILVPIGLILMGSIDLGKSVIASGEDEIKKAQKLFIKRCMGAVAFFLVVTLVVFIMNFIGNNAWQDCWNVVTS